MFTLGTYSNIINTHIGYNDAKSLDCVIPYKGVSICNENPFKTLSTNALGFYAICQTKDQSVGFIMVHETLFYLSKFN